MPGGYGHRRFVVSGDRAVDGVSPGQILYSCAGHVIGGRIPKTSECTQRDVLSQSNRERFHRI